jgi:hypothetical protein
MPQLAKAVRPSDRVKFLVQPRNQSDIDFKTRMHGATLP